MEYTNDIPNYINYSLLHNICEKCSWSVQNLFTSCRLGMRVIEFGFDGLYAGCISAGEAKKSNLWCSMADCDKCNFYRADNGEFSTAPQTPFYDPLSIVCLMHFYKQLFGWALVSARKNEHTNNKSLAEMQIASLLMWARCKYKKRVVCLILRPYRWALAMQTPFANNLAQARDNKYTQRVLW